MHSISGVTIYLKVYWLQWLERDQHEVARDIETLFTGVSCADSTDVFPAASQFSDKAKSGTSHH